MKTPQHEHASSASEYECIWCAACQVTGGSMTCTPDWLGVPPEKIQVQIAGCWNHCPWTGCCCCRVLGAEVGNLKKLVDPALMRSEVVVAHRLSPPIFLSSCSTSVLFVSPYRKHQHQWKHVLSVPISRSMPTMCTRHHRVGQDHKCLQRGQECTW